MVDRATQQTNTITSVSVLWDLRASTVKVRHNIVFKEIAQTGLLKGKDTIYSRLNILQLVRFRYILTDGDLLNSALLI